MSLSTPTLLFGSISLLLLAYTNRFGMVGSLVRNLHAAVKEKANKNTQLISSQILVLKSRLTLIREMQIFGVSSFILCTGSLFALFLEQQKWGRILFFISVLLLLTSLIFALWEVIISKKALDFILKDLEEND